MPADGTRLELLKFKMQLREWNVAAARLPPQSGYAPRPLPEPRLVIPGLFFDYSSPDGPQRFITSAQVSVFLLAAPYMNPLGMHNLARLCRPMRTALMKKESRPIWREMFEKNPSYPPCPRHIIEPHHATMIAGRECSACGEIPYSCQEIEVSTLVRAKIGWVLCDVCLRYNLVDEQELLGLYNAAIPNRPAGVRLLPRNPLSDLRRFLPFHRLSCFSEGGVEVTYYYRPEAELFVRNYLRLMESQEILCDARFEFARNLMVELRVEHATLVNEFADNCLRHVRVAVEANRLGVPNYTLRSAIMERVDVADRHYELEDLQRSSFYLDRFLDHYVTSDDVFKSALPHIWQVLAPKRAARMAKKASDFMEPVLLYFEELVAGIWLSDEERMMLPNEAHLAQIPCIVKFQRKCDEPPTREQFKKVEANLTHALRYGAYVTKLPDVFFAPLEQFFTLHAMVLRYAPPEPETPPARAARLLRTAAAMFTFNRGMVQAKGPVVLPFPEIHMHWRTNCPDQGWDLYQMADQEALGHPKVVDGKGVLHAMVPYAPALYYLRALGFPDDIPLQDMDQIVRDGRVQCRCGLSRLPPNRGVWGWADLLAHCEYEHSQWEKIWGPRSATAAHPASTTYTGVYVPWVDDHAPGGLFYYPNGHAVPDFEADLAPLVHILEGMLHAKPGREIVACRLCCNLAGPGQDRAHLDAYWRVPIPSDRLTLQPLFMAHHLLLRHRVPEIRYEYLVLSQ
ncbi:uncharacterized protein TRAVEDRAFT_53209 [Trametes versicolor FP-101664 SS1]|uniref:uncharacterized protein n=1 Tax=Trametes versicolor (strain FP-101664) TaxID=717944 RepID=UPI0004624576|nr:uncharacterized protein TRAVEDRAFT_53209 [Trametes versicolor FP-101664 SS1]EIW52770.1 hypothetical protein TRAVEDRAFT_53209 [Trametes versicolor FP-101664 SS1]